MSNNLYGYVDYHGPRIEGSDELPAKEAENDPNVILEEEEEEENDDDDPLRSGLWMEGDSLAPPCGSSVSLIHSILEFGQVCSKDVLYDFGCGDGRVCLEALVQRDCQHCVGVEIEEDLVQKANSMIRGLPANFQQTQDGKPPRIQVLQTDLREILQAFVAKGNSKEEEEGSGSSDLPMPTIIILYLLPESIQELEKDLIALLNHARIVCNTWGLPSLKESATVEISEGVASTSLFLYEKI